MRRFAVVAIGLLLWAAVDAPSARAATEPTGVVADFRLASYPTGQAPYTLTNYFWLAGGGLLTSGRDGTITYVPPGGPPTTIATVPGVRTVGDHALLGFARANDYATSGTVYLSYEKGDVTSGYGMVEQWTASPPRAPTSFTYASTLIDGSTTSPPLFEKGNTHGLDSVVVAPDDTLFVSIGDNSTNHLDPTTLRAQDLDQPYGKLLHITATGAGVSTNPFYAAEAPSSWRSQIYAYGFRNPFRFALDPRTDGLIHLGDVGWIHQEELDTIRAGDNGGWPCYEGTRLTEFVAADPVCVALYAAGTARAPIVTYRHAGSAAAVVGGMFYTGDSYPKRYRNAFFYGDYNRGSIWTVRTSVAGDLVREPDVPAFWSAVTPVAFQPAPNGDVTFADISAGTVSRFMTAIEAKFASLAHPWKLLGPPTSAEHGIPGGRVRSYLRGRIYWSAATHAHELHGPILDIYLARRGPRGCLGFPVTDVIGTHARFEHGTIRDGHVTCL